jgi:hypothetical protein
VAKQARSQYWLLTGDITRCRLFVTLICLTEALNISREDPLVEMMSRENWLHFWCEVGSAACSRLDLETDHMARPQTISVPSIHAF